MTTSPLMIASDLMDSSDSSPSNLTGDAEIVSDPLLPGCRCRIAEFFVNL